MGQRATSQGAPPRVPSPALFPSPDARDHVAPRATSSQVPRAPAEALPRPDHPPPRSPKAQRRRQAPAPRRRRCPSPGGLSPEEQARAEVRVLQRVGLAHLAGGGGRGPGSRCSGDGAAPGGAGGEAGGSDTARCSLRDTEPPASGSGAPGGCPLLPSAPGAWSRERWEHRLSGLCPGPRRCEARLQAHLMEPLRETAAPKAPDRGAYVWAPGCKFYQRARSEPGPPPRRRRGRGRLHQKRSLNCGEDREKAGTRR